MSSNRSISSRPAALLNPQLRPTITIEEWEAMTPLGALELQSVEIVRNAGERHPSFKSSSEKSSLTYPPASLGSQYPLRPTTPISSPSTSIRLTTAVAPSSHALHPRQPVQTPQQFYDWFTLIDQSVAHSQEAHVRAHVANVKEHLDMCQQLVEKIKFVDKEVGGMVGEWKSVEEGGKNLKDACEKLLEERDKLLGITDVIGDRLQYFQELEHAIRMLNHPGESLVLQADFLYMVDRVDICIDYLKAHRHYREAEIYLFRYQQCMTRAMTLIKMYFVGSLRALSLDISKRLSEQDVSAVAKTHLVYTRFITVSQQLSPLLYELERRVSAHPQELSALLEECHTAYFSTRKGLLVGSIVEDIRGLDPGRTEIVELTRAGCSYLKQLCADEFKLYCKFFNSGEDQLYQYLENICDYLYDDLRPRILHEPRLTALCEVCTVLQALVVLDGPGISGDDSDPENSPSPSLKAEHVEDHELALSMNIDHMSAKKRVGPRLGRRLHIGHLLQMVLQDAQTRLFFKAQAIVQNEVRHYVPTREDLEWPDILIDARHPVVRHDGNEVQGKESISKVFRLTSIDRQDTWFPTLKKTVWVLQQLHNFVKPVIFEDIAQEALNLCRLSLIAASEMVAQRNGNELDRSLFLIRHLMILKEVMKNLDLNPSEEGGIKGVGSGSDSLSVGDVISGLGVTETLASMLSRTTSMLPDSLIASLGMPRAGESIRETQHGIDHDLRRACEAVISHSTESISKPLLEWSNRVITTISPPSLSISHDKKTKAMLLPTKSMLSPTLVSEQGSTSPTAMDQEFRRACETGLRAAVGKLRLYIEDERAVKILVEHVKERIMDAYTEFAEVVQNVYPQVIGGDGAGESVSILGVQKVKSFVEEVFQD